MASQLFDRADRRYFVRAFAQDVTHSGITNYEESLGLSTDGTKVERATEVVKHIFEEVESTDEELIKLLDFVYVEGFSGGNVEYSEAYRLLRDKVLSPKGVQYTPNGFVAPGKAVQQTDPPVPTPSPPTRSVLTGRENSPTAPAASAQADAEPAPGARDGVFVVHGRDTKPLEALETFLYFLGLRVVTWSDAVAMTGQAQPHTYDIVRAGMTSAAAVIVIFSPDEQARIRSALVAPGGTDEEGYQPRQNVLLEAGMAYASSPTKTIFVKAGTTRSISDIDGLNWVPMDGTWDSRKQLIHRLRAAGVDVHPARSNLNDRIAGPFSGTT